MSKLCRAHNILEILGCYKEIKMLSEAQVRGWSESSSIPSHFRWAVPLTKMWIHAPGFTEHPLHWPWICRQMLHAPTREEKEKGKRISWEHQNLKPFWPYQQQRQPTCTFKTTSSSIFYSLQNHLRLQQHQQQQELHIKQEQVLWACLLLQSQQEGTKQKPCCSWKHPAVPCLAPGVQSHSVRLANTKHMTDEDKKKTGKREKPLPKGFNRKFLSLSLSTSSRLQQSQQTNLLAEAKHGEEKKAHGNRNKSQVTISSEQIHQEYNSKSLEMFF